ncbi:family 8 glycosyl transferase [Naviculisporaceae sp. PSN 640]
MAAQGAEDVYASLLLTDNYLPGALVLAHSLRDAGTTKKLAILVTLDSVSAEVISQLKAVYDYVIPVPRIRNEKPANLYLMNRPDLHSAFTKINLWKQTQFRKIVYLDADVVAYRAPDELFALPHGFSAAPDIGWPDLFNTGVMVLTPNLGDYYALMAMADRGISFDGADQGLLNMYFKNTYNRLSFTYNVTPSAHYQYVPAYAHFQSSINMVHFIGSEKPWVLGRDRATGGSPFDEIAGRWWAVYDRYYRKEVTSSQPRQQLAPELVQYFVKGEYQPRIDYVVPIGEPSRGQPSTSHGQQYQQSSYPSVSSQLHFEPHDQRHQHFDFQNDISREPSTHQHSAHDHSDYYSFAPEIQHHHNPYHDQRHDQHHDQKYDHQHVPHHEPPQQHHHHYSQHEHHDRDQSQPGSSVQTSTHSVPPPSESFRTALSSQGGQNTEARKEQAPAYQERASHPSPPQPKPEPKVEPQLTISWDAQRQPPPPDSRPEAMNFPQTHYVMSSDTAPFVPPERYPSPPKNMWYEVPKEAPAPPKEKPKPIFPWENNQPRPARVFAHQEPEVTSASEAQFPPTSAPENQSTASQVPTEPSVTESSTFELKSEPETPTQPPQPPIPWSSFPRTNAWDDVPEITRYVDAIQKHRRTRSQGLSLSGLRAGKGGEQSWGRQGLKVTDFPSEDDRPSLPVTPAPIRRPRFWGGGGPGADPDREDDDEKLPAAEGVPAQCDWVCVHGIWWTPADCLCDLANVLHYHKDPVAQLQKLAKQQSEMLLQKLGGSIKNSGDGAIGSGGQELPSRALPLESEDIKSETYEARSAGVLSPKPVKPDVGPNVVSRILAAESAGEIPDTDNTGPSNLIPKPSYKGPGAAFEKGEDIPNFETPALPTEEELDTLET